METEILIENDDEELEKQESTSTETKTNSRRTDLVWQYYEIDSKKKEWKCRLCKNPRKFKYTTECPSSTLAKTHLKSFHSKESATLEKESKIIGNAEIKKKKQPERNQPTLNFAPPSTYAPDYAKQKEFDKRIVYYACNPTVTIYQLKTSEFRGLFDVADPKLTVPGDYKAFKSLINKFYQKKKEVLIRKLSKHAKFSTMLDIWSDSNMNNSYLGVSLQFCDGDCLKRVFLQMRPLSNKHTGIYIRQTFLSILNEFGLSEDALLRVVTDNAANIIKAFQYEEAEEESEDENEQSEGEEEEIHLDENEGDQFWDIEIEAEQNWYKRFGCLAHSINLALLYVMKNNLMKLEGFTALRKIINHFNKSHESKKKLVETAGVSLLQFCPTRWAQWLKAVERFLQIKEHVKKIVRAKGISFPKQEEIEHFHSAVVFLKPIVDLLELIQSENKATLSMVFPMLKNFLNDSERQNMESKSFMDLLRSDLNAQIRKRFGFILERGSENFDRFFLLATLLDPNYCWLMDEDDEFLAKLYLKNRKKIRDGMSSVNLQFKSFQFQRHLRPRKGSSVMLASLPRNAAVELAQNF